MRAETTSVSYLMSVSLLYLQPLAENCAHRGYLINSCLRIDNLTRKGKVGGRPIWKRPLSLYWGQSSPSPPSIGNISGRLRKLYLFPSGSEVPVRVRNGPGRRIWVSWFYSSKPDWTLDIKFFSLRGLWSTQNNLVLTLSSGMLQDICVSVSSCPTLQGFGLLVHRDYQSAQTGPWGWSSSSILKVWSLDPPADIPTAVFPEP